MLMARRIQQAALAYYTHNNNSVPDQLKSLGSGSGRICGVFFESRSTTQNTRYRYLIYRFCIQNWNKTLIKDKKKTILIIIGVGTGTVYDSTIKFQKFTNF
jgi:hypothetical protein